MLSSELQRRLVQDTSRYKVMLDYCGEVCYETTGSTNILEMVHPNFVYKVNRTQTVEKQYCYRPPAIIHFRRKTEVQPVKRGEGGSCDRLGIAHYGEGAK
jgi:hypothetical protein